MIMKMSEKVGPDLATRKSCDRLFQSLEQTPEKQITLDFSKTQSISRSFAHQYLMRKNSSTKIILEIHVPKTVQEMINFVKNESGKKPTDNWKAKYEIISDI